MYIKRTNWLYKVGDRAKTIWNNDWELTMLVVVDFGVGSAVRQGCVFLSFLNRYLTKKIKHPDFCFLAPHNNANNNIKSKFAIELMPCRNFTFCIIYANTHKKHNNTHKWCILTKTKLVASKSDTRKSWNCCCCCFGCGQCCKKIEMKSRGITVRACFASRPLGQSDS